MIGGSHRPTNFSWVDLNEANSESFFIQGGVVITAKADLALLVGDAVYLTAGPEVTKNTTVANYAARVGIVVGGEQTDNAVVQDDALIGVKTAANAGEKVRVCILGIAKAKSGAAITAFASVSGGNATAGRVETNTTAGQIIGQAIDAATGAAEVVRVLVMPR